MGDLTLNFNLVDYTCKCGCGLNIIKSGIVYVVQFTRDIARVPIVVTSGCRCPSHNKAVGGVEGSLHVKGEAVDIMIPGNNGLLKWLCETILSNWSGGLHYYDSGGDAHLDIGPKRRW